ncbi:MAG: prolipoprotein diacylglyceryl transferase family protein [Microthrixaceae bacterium]
MIDFRLGVSVLLAVIVPTLVAKRWAADRLPEGVWAPTSGAVLAGVFAGRLLWLAVDHPSGLTAPLEVLSVRSGLAFWPAVLVGIAGSWAMARRRGGLATWLPMAAAAVPYLVMSWGLMHATCLIRDGCPGPRAAIGLVPEGLSSRVLPMGLLCGAIVVAATLWWSSRPATRRGAAAGGRGPIVAHRPRAGGRRASGDGCGDPGAVGSRSLVARPGRGNRGGRWTHQPRHPSSGQEPTGTRAGDARSAVGSPFLTG